MVANAIPPKPDDPSHHTTVRIAAGIYGLPDEVDKASTAGNFPDVRLFDKRGEFIGRNKDFPHVDAGGFKEVYIEHEQKMDGRQSEYLAISAAGDDAICINYVTITWPDGTSWGFLGDVGTMCGARWYYSDTVYEFHSAVIVSALQKRC
jgi:hypothetical protein